MHALACEELIKDALHHGSRLRVRFKRPEPLASGCLARIRVCSDVRQAVSVWRSTTEEAPFEAGLGSHCGTDSSFDAVPFPFAHPAVETHHDFVGIGAGINWSPHLRDPEADTVVNEDRKGEPELVAIEGSLRLSYDNCFKRSTQIGQAR